MVLFWSHFMTHFSQTGLIFKIETSNMMNNSKSVPSHEVIRSSLQPYFEIK
jgi:hypothetical protein